MTELSETMRQVPDHRLVFGARRRGFTLVELLVTFTIAGVVLGAMMAFFVGQVRSSRLADTRIEAVQRARFAAELLRREISLAGSGMPNAQPMVVFAGASDLVFSSDLASSTPGDRISLYVVPDAPVAETEGADSATMMLPNGQTYPLSWYGGTNGMSGPAETVHFGFVEESPGEYALVRGVNGLAPDTLLRNLEKLGSNEFFSYEVFTPEGLRDIGSGPVWHRAPIHGSPADTAISALADSVKLVHVRFKVRVQGRRSTETVERNFAMAVAMKNAGLVQNSSCGDPPQLGVVPAVTFRDVPPRVDITWAPAADERGGEEDVFQYTLYRRKVTETREEPIATVPPDAAVATYLYTDTDVEPGETYIYWLGATDCTPAQSTLAQSAPVFIG
jgi:prepilin-type N-terminal cleavage/methylation domain-containing protein